MRVTRLTLGATPWLGHNVDITTQSRRQRLWLLYRIFYWVCTIFSNPLKSVSQMEGRNLANPKWREVREVLKKTYPTCKPFGLANLNFLPLFHLLFFSLISLSVCFYSLLEIFLSINLGKLLFLAKMQSSSVRQISSNSYQFSFNFEAVSDYLTFVFHEFLFAPAFRIRWGKVSTLKLMNNLSGLCGKPIWLRRSLLFQLKFQTHHQIFLFKVNNSCGWLASNFILLKSANDLLNKKLLPPYSFRLGINALFDSELIHTQHAFFCFLAL